MHSPAQARSIAPSRRLAPCRAQRRPFVPTLPPSPYRLPPAVLDRLTRELGGFRNAPAAFSLALFLARHHSMPRRLSRAFPVDRRSLVGHRNLDLSESRIRGALETLEKVGFLVRDLVSGSAYQRTEQGLRRKPVLWRFGPDYAPTFLAANARSKTARGAVPARRPIVPPPAPKMPSLARSVAPRPLPASLFRSPTQQPIGKLCSLGPIPPARPAWTPQQVPIPPTADLSAAIERIRAARARALGGGQ